MVPKTKGRALPLRSGVGRCDARPGFGEGGRHKAESRGCGAALPRSPAGSRPPLGGLGRQEARGSGSRSGGGMEGPGAPLCPAARLGGLGRRRRRRRAVPRPPRRSFSPRPSSPRPPALRGGGGRAREIGGAGRAPAAPRSGQPRYLPRLLPPPRPAGTGPGMGCTLRGAPAAARASLRGAGAGAGRRSPLPRSPQVPALGTQPHRSPGATPCCREVIPHFVPRRR